MQPTEGRRGFLFPDPNPALAQILVSPQMAKLVGDFTSKVLSAYISSLEGRPIDPTDRHPRQMMGATSAEVRVGGFKNDRLVGEITVDVDYAASDIYGRHNPAEGQHGSTYSGSYALTTALYSVLPQSI